MFDHGNRTVLAAGAAHGQGDGFPPLGRVFVEQENQQGFKQAKKSCSGFIFKHIASYLCLLAGVWFQCRHPERIGQKTDVPDQIGLRLAVLETKGR